MEFSAWVMHEGKTCMQCKRGHRKSEGTGHYLMVVVVVVQVTMVDCSVQ